MTLESVFFFIQAAVARLPTAKAATAITVVVEVLLLKDIVILHKECRDIGESDEQPPPPESE